jgi:hypothetical protein
VEILEERAVKDHLHVVSKFVTSKTAFQFWAMMCPCEAHLLEKVD